MAGRFLCVLCVIGAMVLLDGMVLVGAANAQAENHLSNRLRRLELDIQDLQKHLFSERGAPPILSTRPIADAGTRMTAEAASLAVRIQKIESLMRALTGRVDELDFQFKQFAANRDRHGSENPLQSPATGPAALADPNNPLPLRSTGEATGATPGSDKEILGYIKQSDRTTPQSTEGAASTAPAPSFSSPVNRYSYAFSLLTKHDYAAAETAFREFVDAHGDDPLAGNAQYWLGETYYVRKMFAEAAAAFATGYESFPDNPKTADNLLKLGMALARIERIDDACIALGQFHYQFPKAPANLKSRLLVEEKRIKC